MDSNQMLALLDELTVGIERAVSAAAQLQAEAPWGSSPIVYEMLGDLCNADGLATQLYSWAYEQPGTDAWARRPERKKNGQ